MTSPTVTTSERARLLALDLDGTLLRDDGTIDPRDEAAIREARANGCAVTLATGRVTAATLHVARALGLDVPLVCADGRILAEAESGATIEVFTVPQRERALAILREHALEPLLVLPHEIVHEESAREQLGFVTTVWERVQCVSLDDFVGEHPVMLLGLGEADTVREASLTLGVRLGDAVDVACYPLGKGPHVVRVRAPGHDKHTGIARVAERLGIARERVAAIGDWFNDLGMLQWAGHSFAMGGAPESVCAAATEVLDARAGHGGGVAEALSRWLSGD